MEFEVVFKCLIFIVSHKKLGTLFVLVILFGEVLKIVIMKTSHTQFEMMVIFMEHHGDLLKPTNKPRGRIIPIQRWEELTELLNSDGSGDSKPTEKWKRSENEIAETTQEDSEVVIPPLLEENEDVLCMLSKKKSGIKQVVHSSLMSLLLVHHLLQRLYRPLKGEVHEVREDHTR